MSRSLDPCMPLRYVSGCRLVVLTFWCRHKKELSPFRPTSDSWSEQARPIPACSVYGNEARDLAIDYTSIGWLETVVWLETIFKPRRCERLGLVRHQCRSTGYVLRFMIISAQSQDESILLLRKPPATDRRPPILRPKLRRSKTAKLVVLSQLDRASTWHNDQHQALKGCLCTVSVSTYHF
jgi:hypothetical protein